MSKNSYTPLLPAYLAVGEDILKRRRVFEKMRNRIAALGDLSFNHDSFDGEHAAGEDLVSACNTIPFASELRLVEISNCDRLHKDALDAIVSYLKDPSPTTILMMEATKLAKNSRLYKALASLGKNAIIECPIAKGRDLHARVREMAVSHGITLTPGATTVLIELVGEDTLRINTELRKLALGVQDSNPLTDHDIRQMVASTAEIKPWEFSSAFAAHDLKACLNLLDRMESQSPFSLLYRCVAMLKELCCAQSLESRGASAHIAEELGGPAWRYKNHVMWSRRFPPGSLEKALIAARACEKQMKSQSNEREVFRTWLIQTLAERIPLIDQRRQ